MPPNFSNGCYCKASGRCSTSKPFLYHPGHRKTHSTHFSQPHACIVLSTPVSSQIRVHDGIPSYPSHRWLKSSEHDILSAEVVPPSHFADQFISMALYNFFAMMNKPYSSSCIDGLEDDFWGNRTSILISGCRYLMKPSWLTGPVLYSSLTAQMLMNKSNMYGALRVGVENELGEYAGALLEFAFTLVGF